MSNEITVHLDQIGVRLHQDRDDLGRVTWAMIGTAGEEVRVLCRHDYLPNLIEALTQVYQNAQAAEGKGSGRLN